MTASLLIDPSNELNILLTATIQADLRSDNFLTVCTALQAIPTIANAELANVFLPEVVNLVNHDRDQVKRRALVTLHSLLRVDPSIGSEIGKIFVDRLGYREPTVMFAVLPALYELINQDPEPYKGLVHYFTDILKQASEGKLGRNWMVHKAPAPFLQITLLRLLGCLGKGDPQVSSDMQVVLIDVWKRAQSLMNQAGNAILFECMKTATNIVPSDAMYSMALDTSAMFLNSSDNNLKCAGIEILSRLIEDGDSGKVQQHQMAIVGALRSSDETLKGRTLDLLFRMTGPGNLDVVFSEVLEYVTEDCIDEESRKYAASQLLLVSEKFAPSLSWFVDSMTTLLKKAGTLAPSSAQNALVRIIRKQESGTMLQHRITNTYFEMINRGKVSVSLAKVICWTLGEYGVSAGISFQALCSSLVDVLETYSNSSELAIVCILALSKLNSSNAQDLPDEVISILRSLQSSKNLDIQQASYELLSIASQSTEMRRKIIFKKPVDTSLSYLDDISISAAKAGSAPYISKEDRDTMHFSNHNDTYDASDHLLKFEAYERQQDTAGHAAATVDDLFGGLDLQDSSAGIDISNTPEMDKIHVARNDNSRRWGPSSRASPHADGENSAKQVEDSSSKSTGTYLKNKQHHSGHVVQEHIDPQQELLAASLFGTPRRMADVTQGMGQANSPIQSQPVAFDLLDMTSGPNEPVQPESDILDLLGEGSNVSIDSSLVKDSYKDGSEPVGVNQKETNQSAVSDPFEGLI